MNGLYGTSSESTGLYGNSVSFGGTYFEWFIFQDSATAPATPTGGTWDFSTNTGTAPSGWLSAPIANPTQYVWTSVAIVDSRTSTLTWSVPGVLATQGATAGENSNITSLSGITGGISTPDFVQFDTGITPTVGVGKLQWDSTWGCMQVGMAGGNVNLLIGEETVVYIYNNTGSTISKGQAVKVLGSQGQRLTVALAQANSDANSATILGIATENIANNASGFVTTQGLISSISTSGWADGTLLYLSPTVAGGLTSTKPVAPQHLVWMGYVVKGNSGGAGSIYIHTQNGYELDELHDVRITSVSNGQLLKYDSSIPAWVNTSQMVIDSSGNVGIGTSSPTLKLNIASSLNNDGLRIENTNSANTTSKSTRITFYGTDTVGTVKEAADIYVTSSDNNYVSSNMLFFNRVADGVSERMRIDSAGNVGIGTSSPSERLDLGGGNLVLGTTIFTGSGVSTDDVALELGTLRTGSGNVYIDLHAAAGTDYSARFLRFTGANGALQISNTGTGDLRIRQENAAAIAFDTSASEKMRIDSAGNVGIGTASPTAKLDVDSDTVRVRTTKTPASASAAGNAGDICWDSNYVYVCVATNTWKRTALAAW